MQYRNLEAGESLVVSHTVNVGDDVAAVRWYQVGVASPAAREGVSPFRVLQSGTYAPSETNRFFPSIAMDASGDIAMGYSISDASTHPSIGVTGRLVGDPPGEMGEEAIMTAGGGGQGSPFWGNITSMTVDPADGCTFFYTNQYLAESGDFNWLTRIGTFKFPSCTSGPSGTIEGTVSDGADPISGATVTAGASSTSTDAAGHYSLTLPVGTYDMTVTAYGFFPASANGVEVTEDTTTTQDFTLEVAPSVPVNGTVRDSQRGWPLYAQVDVTGPGAPHIQTFTDPVTGYYDVGNLVEGTTYTFVVAALTPGYETGGGTLPVGVPLVNAPFLVKNWLLEAGTGRPAMRRATRRTFPVCSRISAGGTMPPGWTVINNSTGGNGLFPTEWVVVEGSDPCGDYSGNLTGGTGPYAVANSDCPGSTVVLDTTLITPSVDFSGLSLATLRFNEEYQNLGDNADVDVSIDGGTSWTNVLAQNSDVPGPHQVTIDISALAAGEPTSRPGSTTTTRHLRGGGRWTTSCWARPAAWRAPAGWWSARSRAYRRARCSPARRWRTSVGAPRRRRTTPSFAGIEPPYYILYAEAGPQTLVASFPDYWTTRTTSGGAQRGGTSGLPADFGQSHGGAHGFQRPREPGRDHAATETFEMTNTGGAPAPFELQELNVPFLVSTTKGFAPQNLRQEALARISRKGNIGLTSTKGLARMPHGPAPGGPHRISAAGDVLATYMLDLLGPGVWPTISARTISGPRTSKISAAITTATGTWLTVRRLATSSTTRAGRLRMT